MSLYDYTYYTNAKRHVGRKNGENVTVVPLGRRGIIQTKKQQGRLGSHEGSGAESGHMVYLLKGHFFLLGRRKEKGGREDDKNGKKGLFHGFHYSP